MQDFFYPLAALPQWGWCMDMAQLLGSWGLWQCQLWRSAGGYCHRGYGAIRAFYSLWQLCPSEDWAWSWCSCLGRGDPCGAKCAWTQTAWFSLHLDCHRSTASLSASNVSPLSQTFAPILGLDPGFSSLTCQGQVQSYLLSSFPPNFLCPTKFFMVLCILFWGSGSSAHTQLVLQAFLCLKVYSWCIHRERCTPHLPIPPPSCSPPQYPLHFKPHTRSFYPVAAQNQGSLNWHISIKPHITKLRKMCVLLTGKKKMHNLKVEKYVLFGELSEHIKPGR